MSSIYEAIGRLVVAFVSRRYRQELKLAGLAAIVLALLALLLQIRGATGAGPKPADRRRRRSGEGRKRPSGSFVSIR